MSGYVFLTGFLFQRGSPESKPFEGDASDQDPRQVGDHEEVPWSVRRGGLVLGLYEHSFALALIIIFLACFTVHALGGTAEFNQEQLAQGSQPVSVLGFVTTSQFWFQSFQNWQSEFLVVGAVALLGIRLRERGSPESKPVAAPTTRPAPASRPGGCGAAADPTCLGRPGSARLGNLGDRVGAALVVEGILVLRSEPGLGRLWPDRPALQAGAIRHRWSGRAP